MIYCAVNASGKYIPAVDMIKFPDGTFGGSLTQALLDDPKEIDLAWLYDGDHELFQLRCIVDTLKSLYPSKPVTLFMPYVPNARMDRVKRPGQLLTIRSFADMINGMNFSHVTVIDPHSDVTTALLDCVGVIEYASRSLLSMAMSCTATDLTNNVICYPDSGSAKRFHVPGVRTVTCEKVRNFDTGRIESVKLLKDCDLAGKTVYIVDDICSYGGTFHAAAQALKAEGVREVILVVSHCEDSILRGKLFDEHEDKLIRKVFTTNSIFRAKHPDIRVINLLTGELEK